MTPLDVTLTPAQWEHLDRHGWTLTEAPMTECRNTLHDLRNAPVSEYHCPECGRAPYRSKDGDWYCFDPKGESSCRWRGPNPKVTPCCVPVPATVPCPECDGKGWWSRWRTDVGYQTVTCKDCHRSGVVPRTVGIIRPEQVCPACGGMRDVAAADEPNPIPCARCKGLGHFPAERVGTATVTPVPVVQFLSRGPGHEPDPPWTPCNEDYILPFPMVRTNHDSTIVMLHPGLSEATHDVAALFATPPNPGTTVWRLDKENTDEC